MKIKSFATLALAAIAFASCSKMGELSKDNFSVTPSPLEASADQVPVVINGKFPEKYMKKKATVTVTPVLRFAGKEVVGTPTTFQGEKVQGNNQEISYKLGGNYTMRVTFPFQDEMEGQSELYLTFDAKKGNKTYNVPEVMVATGVNATSAKLKAAAKELGSFSKDAYQKTIKQSQEAQIKYLINQSKVRLSELKTTSIEEFVNVLREIKANQKGLALEGIEISAYASPDGKESFNEKLAEARQKTSAAYVQKQLKEIDLNTTLDTKYTAEDWEGFKELVAASNIQDKEVIIRVLSMYSDPEERERQIKNISAAYTELVDEVLPELRRARLTVNYMLIGRTDAEIAQQYNEDASKLSVEELLYLATLEKSADKKKNIYTTTTKYYPNDYRAYNNLANLSMKENQLQAAQGFLDRAVALNANAAEVNANLAALAMTKGNVAEGEKFLGRAAGAENYSSVLANIQGQKGDYKAAAKTAKGTKSSSAALTQILNKDYAGALATLNSLNADEKTATTEYFKAICAARTNNVDAAISALKSSFSMDPSMKERAKKDMEFSALTENAAFKALF